MIGVEYIAGFFDGEGCIAIAKDSQRRHSGKRPSYTLLITLANTDRRPLDWLYKRFGGNIRAATRLPNQTVYYWQLQAQKALSFLEWVRPYLVVKATQAWLGLEFMAQRGLGGGRGRILSDEQYAVREGYYLALQSAKRAA